MGILTAARNDERGAGFVEYAIVASLIALVAITGVTLLGNTVAESFSDSGGQVVRGGPVEASRTAEYEDEISATFEVTNGRVYLGAVAAEGWTYRVTRDTGRRITMKFTNTENGDIVRVNGWLNNKDKLKSKVRKR